MNSGESLRAIGVQGHDAALNNDNPWKGRISGMKIPQRAATGTASLWIVAVLLMVYDTVTGSGAAGRWALLIGLAATSATVSLAITRARRVVLEVMSWEHWMMDSVKKEEQEQRATVRAIR